MKITNYLAKRAKQLAVPATLAAALLGTTATTQALVLTYQEGDGGAFSSTDASRFGTTRSNGTLNTNLGSNSTLNTDTTFLGAPDQYFMIGFFDLIGAGAGQVALGSTITSATLRFSQTSNTSNGLQGVFHVLHSWDEDTVTNQNFFSGTYAHNASARAPLAGIDHEASTLTTFRPNSGSFFDVDITSAVQDWANGQSNFGLLLMNIDGNASRATDGWVVHSDDASNQALRPLLTVVVQEAPEPASLALFGSALFACGVAVRRRKGRKAL